MLRSNDQTAFMWQRLFQPNKEQQQQQHTLPSAMMNLSDNWQQARRLQQLHQFQQLQQQVLPSAPAHHFQDVAIGQRTRPFFLGFPSTLQDVQQYQALQGMIAEEEHLLKLRQLRQLHDLQKYQDLVAQERMSGSTRAEDFVTAASPVFLREPSVSFNPTSTPKIADDSAPVTIAATTIIITAATTVSDPSTPTATTSTTEASVPTPASEKDEDETSVSTQKRKSKKKDTKWLVTLGELKKYREEHGDCIVPRGYALNPRLASWVAEQRKQYKLLQDAKQSSITPERISLLSEIDFAWNAQEAAWARHMTDLKKFRKEAGHCHVPLSHDKYPRLGLWVKEQRRHYTLLKDGKQSHMTTKRASKLDKVGFCWDTHEATWLERLRELTDYKEKYGSCAVPTNYTENPKLGTWVHHQRRQRRRFKDSKRCHITLERIKALDQLGFVWYPRRESNSNHDGNSSSDCTDSVTDPSSSDFRPSKRHKTH